MDDKIQDLQRMEIASETKSGIFVFCDSRLELGRQCLPRKQGALQLGKSFGFWNFNEFQGFDARKRPKFTFR
jgi:hypothetical protein